MGGKYTKSQAEATRRYLKKMDEFRIIVPKGNKGRYMTAANKCDCSLNKYVIEAIEEKLARDGE